MYLSRVIKSDLLVLKALLFSRNAIGKHIGWIDIIKDDLQVLANSLPDIFENVPSLDVDPGYVQAHI